LYKKALDAPEDFPVQDYYICKICGYTAAKDLPDVCPVCGANSKGFFKVE
jgi:rubrerythrin